MRQLATFLPLALAAALTAQTPIYTLRGESPGTWFGWAVAGVGDVDRDGFADFAAFPITGRESAVPWFARGAMAECCACSTGT
ncbi:MAG: integrin alpha [Planctomycetota bacterium]